MCDMLRGGCDRQVRTPASWGACACAAEPPQHAHLWSRPPSKNESHSVVTCATVPSSRALRSMSWYLMMVGCWLVSVACASVKSVGFGAVCASTHKAPAPRAQTLCSCDTAQRRGHPPRAQPVAAGRLLLGGVAVQDVVVTLRQGSTAQHAHVSARACLPAPRHGSWHTHRTPKHTVQHTPPAHSARTASGGQAQMNICSKPRPFANAR